MDRNKKLIEIQWNQFKTKKAVISISEAIIMILSTFAFAFIIGGMTIGLSKSVNAEEIPPTPKGCCTQANDGSICQEMNLLDKASCKNAIVGTSCGEIEPCRIGCCYNPQEGICSLNSPKEKCESNGGNWTNAPACNIPQCVIGCCVLGDSASITTTRECTKISEQLNFKPNFQSLDPDGSCNSKTGLGAEGACVTSTGDFSGENNCKFTTKALCKTGAFYEDYLCTAKALNTICRPAKNTTCLENKDQVYYLDTCGNTANVYDASKFGVQSYWEQVIKPADSCGPANNDPTCGNCDYTQGSLCYQYRQGKDAKPAIGDNICRNLNCANGKKHGESWCISDYENKDAFGVAPVGSRWFMGVCMDGELRVEPCADFNQEVCIENKGVGPKGSSFSEARCVVNEWRSCLGANQKYNYNEVEVECKKYPDACEMFLNTPEATKYSGLPGFKTNTNNEDQGSVNGIGTTSNNAMTQCVPKYTPGMVFWDTPNPISKTASTSTNPKAPSTGQTTTQSYTGMGNGGDLQETKNICSLGSFTCVKSEKKSTLTGSWADDKNTECFDKDKVPILMEALNERCRMQGPCGSYVNIAGELGSSKGYSVSAKHISAAGEQEKYKLSYHNLSADYLDSLKEKAGLKKPGSIKTIAQLIVLSLLTGRVVENAAVDQAIASQSEYQQEVQQNTMMSQAVGQLGWTALAATGGFITPIYKIAEGTQIVSGTFTQGTFNVGGMTITPIDSTTISSAQGATGSTTTLTGETGAGQTFSNPAVAGKGLVGTNSVIVLKEGAPVVSGTSAVKDALVSLKPGGSFTFTTGSGDNLVTTSYSLTKAGLEKSVQQGSQAAVKTVDKSLAGASTAKATLPEGAKVTEGAGTTVAPGQEGSLTGSAKEVAKAGGDQAKSAGFDFTKMGVGIVASLAAYYIVQGIGQHNGWSPGETAAWASVASSVAGVVLIGIIYGFASIPVFGWILALLAIVYAIFSYQEEYKYYILTYTCEPWSPPLKGDCNSCNDDVRACSENRCRSLGLNCHYFNDAGEPGWCSELNEIWSAKITPWKEALSEGNNYAEITDKGFKINGENSDGKVKSWIPLQFGIITDKPAQCRIDSKHTKSFDEMSTEMVIDSTGCEISGCSGSLGLKHKVALSSSISANKSADATMSLVPDSDNNYYIRCRNFAGQTNEAEFAVKLITDNGEDLAPPIITGFNPISGNYLKVGMNMTGVSFFVSEPAECRYSQNVNNRFEEMKGKTVCITNEESAVLGNWPCAVQLSNLTVGENKFYFQCQDKPDLPNGTIERKNINRNSKEYSINVCSTNLTISNVYPQNQLVAGKLPITADLKVTTSGCIDGGKARCYYRFADGMDVEFYSTNAKNHQQIFTGLDKGLHKVLITCQDDAGNKASANATIDVYIDNQAPIITRYYNYENLLVVNTNEKAECRFNKNSTLGCQFEYTDANTTLMDGLGLIHATPWKQNENYYIKCKDQYNNTNFDCAAAISTYDLVKDEYVVTG